MMMWDYQYLDLTEDQKSARRAALDCTGHTVVLSQLAVAAAIALHRYLRPPGDTRGRSAAEKLAARVAWHLSSPLALNYPSLRNTRDWIVVAAWMSWCMYLVVAGAGNGGTLF